MAEFGQGFGLGFCVRKDAGRNPTPGSVGDFYWSGVHGTYFWVDPQEQLIGVLMLCAPELRRHYRALMRQLVYQAIEDRVAPRGAATPAPRLAWMVCALAAGCGLAELLAGLGYRRSWWSFRSGIQMLRWSATADAGVAVLALPVMLLAATRGARGALVAGAAGLVLSLPALAPPLNYWRLARELPPIHDISTDTEHPPRFVALRDRRKGAENSTEYSAQTAALQQRAYPDIAPAMLALPPARAYAKAERAARAMAWDLVAAAPADLRIEATATTLLFGFKDDIVIRVAPAAGGSRVDVRSLSRVGRSDLGANAARIRKFLSLIRAG